MQHSTRQRLRIGDWRVDPSSGEICRDTETARLEARTMRLLMCLAEHAGQTVSIDDLLNEVWTGVNVGPDSVYQAVASLRRLLGDDPRHPTYIANVPRLGYRLVATVRRSEDEEHRDTLREAELPSAVPSVVKATQAGMRVRAAAMWAMVAATLLVLFGTYAFRQGWIGHRRPVAAASAAEAQKSLAVLPFLDLTEGMSNEEFADGMTEELIDKLSKIPGLRVPSATAAFYFKDKRVPLTDIGKTLGVAYVLDGSVRKAGTRLRVAARLVRPENGYVVWTESYDRPTTDLLWVQDDIAGEVAKALSQSIAGEPGRDSSN